MSKQIIAKQIGRNGSSSHGHVTWHVSGTNESLLVTDHQFAYTYDGTTASTVQFTPTSIEIVMNTGTSSCFINGQEYGTGRWDLASMAAIPTISVPVITFTTAGATANMIVTLRGTSAEI